MRYKLDIEVADNHNYYLASGALVHNCATDDEYRSNILREFVFLNRHGRAYQHLRGRVDPESWRIEMTEEVPWDEPKPEDEQKRRPSKRRPGVPQELLEA